MSTKDLMQEEKRNQLCAQHATGKVKVSIPRSQTDSHTGRVREARYLQTRKVGSHRRRHGRHESSRTWPRTQVLRTEKCFDWEASRTGDVDPKRWLLDV